MRNLTDTMVMRNSEALLAFAEREARDGARRRRHWLLHGRPACAVAAGTFPDDMRAAACLHGTNLVTDGPYSPHRIAAHAKGEIYCGFAEHDRFAAPEVMSALDGQLKAAGVTYRLVASS